MYATTTATEKRPAFTGVRWNGWAIFGIALLLYLAFLIVQQIIFTILFFQQNPEIANALRTALLQGYMAPAIAKQLQDPALQIRLLTAKNLWLGYVLSAPILIFGTIGFAKIAFHADLRDLGLGIKPTARAIALGVVTGVFLLFASGLVDAVLTHFFGPHPQPQAKALAHHHGVGDFLLDFMSVSVAAPIAEEILFRGLIFTGLVQRMAPAIAICISAAAFGLAHIYVWTLLPIFVIGTGLAWLYYREKTLWANITAHATVNFVSLVVAFAFPKLAS